MPSIDRNSSVPFYLQVYTQIANGIESGVYPAGKKLPSIRECARELGVSNTTIELAYQRLTEEGYVQSRRGSGYTICQFEPTPKSKFDRFSSTYKRDLELLEQSGKSYAKLGAYTYDFAYDQVDSSTFPFNGWARICREVFFSPESKDACSYNDCQGLKVLREQISQYLEGEYGLSCSAEQILVMPTTRDLISQILTLFNLSRITVAVGNPGYDEVVKRLMARNCKLKAIPAFPYPTWEQLEPAIEGADLVFATPACQFPTNQTMPIEIRTALVEWAKEHDAYLLDDEYAWEFQSGVTRMPPLAALDDEGRVITLGTFSNSFTPAVCLSYAVLPPQLMLKWRKRHFGTHPQVPWQTQAAMASFMRDDYWRTHIRKMRTSIIKKRKRLLTALETHLPDRVEIIKGSCSLFMLVNMNDGRSEEELIEAAARAGVRVYPTNQYWHDAPPDDWRYVLVGYAGIPERDIEPGIKALAQAWEQ